MCGKRQSSKVAWSDGQTADDGKGDTGHVPGRLLSFNIGPKVECVVIISFTKKNSRRRKKSVT